MSSNQSKTKKMCFSPAVEFPNDKQWYLHGKMQKADGPAIEKASG